MNKMTDQNRPISIFVSSQALRVFLVALCFENPPGAVVAGVFVGDPVFTGALLDRSPDNLGRFARAGFFPDLPDDGVADDPVDPVVQVASEAIWWFVVVPGLDSWRLKESCTTSGLLWHRLFC